MSIAELPATAEPAIAAADSEALYELVDGLVREKTVGNIEIHLGFEIGALLRDHVRAMKLGRIFVEGMFRTQAVPKRIRRPDVAFVSDARLPLDRPIPDAASFTFAPDLAVEVVSPTDLAVDLQEKIEEYFRADVRQVWTVYHRTATITVHESPALARSYRRGELVDGGDLLPGFRLAVADLLPEFPATPPTEAA